MDILKKDPANFETLVELIRDLRSPEGCPWDREQDHLSMRDALLEECYEALEAIDEADATELCSELGDLLCQVVFHAQIAAESNEFNMGDVVSSITAKLIRRHPHVFAGAKRGDTKDILASWEAIKREERGAGTTIFSSIPRTLPALAFSQEIQERAGRVGFDWEDDSGLLEKVAEEAGEIAKAHGKEEKEDELGDLLFVLVNLARRQGVDAESALRKANQRFLRRFEVMERLAREVGSKFEDLSAEEKNTLWEQAKDILEHSRGERI